MPTHPELVAAFAAGLVDGTLPKGLTAQAPDEAARRFAVYRNNVAVGLSDALAKRFPVIQRLVGAEYFRAIASLYLNANRPKSPVIMEWGDTFPQFLARFEPLAAYRYMADVARIEVARGRAYHAADATPIAPERLAAAAANPAEAVLALHASVQVLTLSHPAVSIWNANQPGAAPTAIATNGPETALVLRDRSFDIPVTAIGAGDAALIASLKDGHSLLSAAGIAAVAETGHNPEPILVRLIQAGAIITPKDLTCSP